MENKKSQLKKNKSKLVISLLAAVLAITIAFLAGYAIANMKVPLLESQLNAYQQNLESLSLTATIGSSNSSLSCSILEGGLSSLNQELNNLNQEITAADSNSMYSSYYSSLIDQFTYVRINYWLLAQRIENQCRYNIVNVLMLYPQNGCSNCGTEGEELSYIEQKSNYSVIATVLNANVNISAVKLVDKEYNVTSYPTLIINENVTQVGYESTQQLISTICKYAPKITLCSQ
jgi:hypothetical protein